MLHELCITLTMRAVALGHSLAEARCLAAAALLQLVLLCTLFGYQRVPQDETRPENHAVPFRARRFVSSGIRGIFPAPAGTAGRLSAALLHS